MSRLKKSLEKLGIKPRELAHYRRAFTHRSYIEDPAESYERLEFLGDSIIGMVVSDLLFRKFPEKEEGELTRIKAIVVSGESLGSKAEELGLEQLLRADTARMRNNGQMEFSILADCFEALVGAIFSDLGYRSVRSFINKHLGPKCIELSVFEGPADFKSRLQELWQQRHKELPVYRVVDESGPDHDKMFTVEVRYGRRLLGRGTGSSKKRAEQEAARAALEKDSRSKKGKDKEVSS
jgi:ribonuclease-3